MKWVNLLSMTFILLGFGKVGSRGTLQRSECEALRYEMFKN